MRLKNVLIFLLAIVIPTALLAYFGLGAVQSEKSIVEKSIRQRHEAVADIVENEIARRLSEMPPEMLKNERYVEAVLIGEASTFKDQVRILDEERRDISASKRSFVAAEQRKRLGKEVLRRPIKRVPYAIAVYERHPHLLKELEEKKKGLVFYIALIAFSAITILCGGFFTLWALSREWHLAALKSEFVSHLSHDLRRPLTSIRMFSEMLKENRVPSEEKKQEYYTIITNESERLTHLANNILDFSRIESGRKKYKFQKENISEVVRLAVDSFKEHMKDTVRQVRLDIKEDSLVCRIDAESISQALMNLLANAAKFSPPEKEIQVKVARKKNEVAIEVIDQGIGIPKSEQRKIFHKYYRVSKKQVSNTEGSGLGLTLVKYIALAHKGRITVDSEEGQGAKFTLVLPS